MGRSSRFASLFLLLLGGCASAPSPTESVSLNQTGTEAYRRGDLAAAREAFGKAIQVSAKGSESFVVNALSLARVEQAAGDADAAHRALDQVLGSGAAPGLRAEAAGRKALLYLSAADLKQAADWQARAQALCESCRAQGAILNIGARIALASGQPEAATQLAERVLKLPASDEMRAEQANARRILSEASAAQAPAVSNAAVR
jgi:tetratricopeptide (TPR) repeat protein